MKLYRFSWIVLSSGLLVSPLAFAYSAPVEMREQPQVAIAKPFSSAETGERPAISEPLSPSQQSVQGLRGQQLFESARFDKLEQLFEEVSQLRGQVEIQEHLIQQLQSTQQRQYQDIDSRLVATEALAKSKGSHSFFRSKSSEVENTAKPEPISQEAPQQLSGEQVLDQQRLYGLAYSYLKNKEFLKARPILEEYLVQYPTGQYAVNAHYWLGELLLVSGETQQAKVEFNTVVSNYPTSSKIADAMLKLGFIYADEGQSTVARKQLLKIKELYPNSATAKLADQRLSRIEGAG